MNRWNIQFPRLVGCMKDRIKDLSLGMELLGTWCERVPQILLICALAVFSHFFLDAEGYNIFP